MKKIINFIITIALIWAIISTGFRVFLFPDWQVSITGAAIAISIIIYMIQKQSKEEASQKNQRYQQAYHDVINLAYTCLQNNNWGTKLNPPNVINQICGNSWFLPDQSCMVILIQMTTKTRQPLSSSDRTILKSAIQHDFNCAIANNLIACRSVRVGLPYTSSSAEWVELEVEV